MFVSLISTIHSMAAQEVKVKVENVLKPELEIDYNDTMGGGIYRTRILVRTGEKAVRKIPSRAYKGSKKTV